MELNDELRAEYLKLWETCKVKPTATPYVNKAVATMRKNKSIYDGISKITGVPWWFIGMLHYMECGQRLNAHLHNGDPLKALTVNVPKGRPVIKVNGVLKLADFGFAESAIDALKFKGYDKVKDWSLPRVLFLLEGYNGFGYRLHHPEVKTPYLWSFTSHYSKGKYVKDGIFDHQAVSLQLGLACLLKGLGVF